MIEEDSHLIGHFVAKSLTLISKIWRNKMVSHNSNIQVRHLVVFTGHDTFEFMGRSQRCQTHSEQLVHIQTGQLMSTCNMLVAERARTSKHQLPMKQNSNNSKHFIWAKKYSTFTAPSQNAEFNNTLGITNTVGIILFAAVAPLCSP